MVGWLVGGGRSVVGWLVGVSWWFVDWWGSVSGWLVGCGRSVVGGALTDMEVEFSRNDIEFSGWLISVARL